MEQAAEPGDQNQAISFHKQLGDRRGDPRSPSDKRQQKTEEPAVLSPFFHGVAIALALALAYSQCNPDRK